MDMKKTARTIYSSLASNTEKQKLLKDLLLDCLNEMEAQDQNMRPEVQHNLSEGFRVAKNYIRELERP